MIDLLSHIEQEFSLLSGCLDQEDIQYSGTRQFTVSFRDPHKDADEFISSSEASREAMREVFASKLKVLIAARAKAVRDRVHSQKEAARARREAIFADPTRYSEFLARQRGYYRASGKHVPRALYPEGTNADAAKRFRERKKQDPVAWEEYRKKIRAQENARRKARRSLIPE